MDNFGRKFLNRQTVNVSHVTKNLAKQMRQCEPFFMSSICGLCSHFLNMKVNFQILEIYLLSK